MDKWIARWRNSSTEPLRQPTGKGFEEMSDTLQAEVDRLLNIARVQQKQIERLMVNRDALRSERDELRDKIALWESALASQDCAGEPMVRVSDHSKVVAERDKLLTDAEALAKALERIVFGYGTTLLAFDVERLKKSIADWRIHHPDPEWTSKGWSADFRHLYALQVEVEKLREALARVRDSNEHHTAVAIAETALSDTGMTILDRIKAERDAAVKHAEIVVGFENERLAAYEKVKADNARPQKE